MIALMSCLHVSYIGSGINPQDVKELAIFVSVFLAIGGAGLSAWASKLGELLGKRSGTLLGKAMGDADAGTRSTAGARLTIDGAPKPSVVARGRVMFRIREAATSCEQQLSVKKWSKMAANFLTIAQYIIGGVLASSFVQQSLTPKWVGVLGVLVLIASLFKQQFHPEINADDAQKKAFKLRALIRSSEDQVAILDAKIATGQDHTDAMIALLTHITQRLTEIEDPEVNESTPKELPK
jgi:hypothetical protein